MSDSRDTNHDGKVSLMEKVKDKLHLGHKDNTIDTTHSTHHTAALPATHHTTTTTALPATHHTTTAAMPVAAMPLAVAPMAVAALPVATTGYTSVQSSSYSQDLNGDGRVSLGEKIATSGSHSHNTGAMHDSRDLNHDGRVSLGEKAIASGATHNHGSLASSTGVYDQGLATGRLDSDKQKMTLHEEQLAISKQQVSAGEVGIHKRVEAERVEHTVPLRREEVIVERRPLSGIADPNARIMEQDEIVRVPLHREEVIMEKRIVPTEEVIVRKKEVIENQVVGATLRSEYVDTVQTQASSLSGYADSRDLNRDGHVSMGEKLKSATGSHAAGYTDSRDLNRDGHVSLKEKAVGQADFNKDGHVSAGEGLRAASNMKAARG